MNKKYIIAAAVLVIAILMLLGAKQKGPNFDNRGGAGQDYVVDESDMIRGANIPIPAEILPLTEEEKAGLILMREEEKLARDVYTYLGSKWGDKIFGNIAASEQTHTEAVKTLLARYGVEDPVKNDAMGEFTSTEMLNLYKDLTLLGGNSELDAFIVGAIIEDLDIKDLEELMKKTDKEDILAVYANLQKGSRNHLRAYSRKINSFGATYAPRYISEEMYRNIISSEQERGFVQSFR